MQFAGQAQDLAGVVMLDFNIGLPRDITKAPGHEIAAGALESVCNTPDACQISDGDTAIKFIGRIGVVIERRTQELRCEVQAV